MNVCVGVDVCMCVQFFTDQQWNDSILSPRATIQPSSSTNNCCFLHSMQDVVHVIHMNKSCHRYGSVIIRHDRKFENLKECQCAYLKSSPKFALSFEGHRNIVICHRLHRVGIS